MKIAIAGAGSIVPQFLAAVKRLRDLGETVELTGICASGPGSRSYGKMQGFAEEYGIGRIYDSFAQMLEEGEQEAVYIAVPNHLHYAYSKAALEKGFHVLCEKPLCTCAAEAEELFDLAESRGLLFMEAISNICLPNYKAVREHLPVIGRVRVAEFNYSQYSSRYDAFRRGEIHPVFDPEKHGGALMDINVYNIHLAVGLFGEPSQVQYFPNMQRNIDTSGVLVLRWEGRAQTAVLTGSKDCMSASCQKILGEEGGFFGECAPNSLERISLVRRDGTKQEFALQEYPERLFYEVQTFLRAAAGEEEPVSRQQSLAVMRVLDAAGAVRDGRGTYMVQ